MKTALSRDEVRVAILGAADRLLARRGYKKMTVGELAREAGIGKGTVYLHFASKEEVALSHVDAIVERLKGRLRETARSKAAPAEKLRRMLVERVTYRLDSVQHYTESLDELLAALRPDLLARRQRYFEEEAEIFAAVLRDGQRRDVFAAGDNPLKAARLLVAATNSLLPYSLSVRELGMRDEIEDQASRLATLLLNGLLLRRARR
jgi:AcrR family transcriptional regulator